MKFKKFFIIISIILISIINVSYSLENKIILKIDRDIITSLDIENDAKYLSALNPKIMELNDIKIFKISKIHLSEKKLRKLKYVKIQIILDQMMSF